MGPFQRFVGMIQGCIWDVIERYLECINRASEATVTHRNHPHNIPNTEFLTPFTPSSSNKWSNVETILFTIQQKEIIEKLGSLKIVELLEFRKLV